MANPAHDDLFSKATPAARKILVRIRQAVEKSLPGVERCIGYGMPAFRRGKTFFYFAAFRKHVGIYPPVRDDAGLIRECVAYRGPKGNLSFPLDEPIPLDLIVRVARALDLQVHSALPEAGKRTPTNRKKKRSRD